MHDLRKRRPFALWGAIAFLAAGALAGIACGGDDDDASPLSLQTLELDIGDVNDSGYEGQLFIVSGDNARSVLTAVLGRDDERQGDFPASIQTGTCEGLAGREAHELDGFSGGYLSQEIPASLSSLTENDHAFVVFQSDDRRVYLACADIEG